MSRNSYITNDNISVKLVTGAYDIEAPYPPISEDNVVVFREFLTLNGDGINRSMRVNGSVTNQDFYISAVEGFDIYITTLCFYIAAELVVVDINEFGNLPALTNGCSLFYQTNQLGNIIINDSIKSNFDLLNVGNFKPSFGTGAGSFAVDAATALTSEGYMPILTFTDFGFGEDGILLLNNTTDKLVFRIRDNLNVGVSSISQFDVVAHGFKRKI